MGKKAIEILHKIVRLTKFPTLMLTITCSALLLAMAFRRLPAVFTMTVPTHECTFVHLSLEEQQRIEHILQEKTQKISFFGGVGRLGQELLAEVPTLTDVSCSLGRDKKLYVVATGSAMPITGPAGSKSIAQQTLAHHEKVNTNKPLRVAGSLEKPFNTLISSPKEPMYLATQQNNVESRTPASVLLNQRPPSFNPEILVSDKRN